MKKDEKNRLEWSADQQEVTLVIDNKIIDRARFSELVAFYDLSAGWDVHATDTEGHILLFGDRYWILPGIIPGGPVLWQVWREKSKANNILKSVVMELLPWSWRCRLWGFLPIHEVRPMCVRSTQLPEFQERTKTRVEMNGAIAKFFIKGKLVDIASQSELVKIYSVEAGDFQFGNETSCVVILFKDRYWVLPTGGNTLTTFIRSWIGFAKENKLFSEVILATIPMKWCVRALGIFPFHQPRAYFSKNTSLPNFVVSNE